MSTYVIGRFYLAPHPNPNKDQRLPPLPHDPLS